MARLEAATGADLGLRCSWRGGGRGGGANTIQAKLMYDAPTASAIVDQMPGFACVSHTVAGSATITALSGGRILMLFDIGRSVADVEPPTSTLD